MTQVRRVPRLRPASTILALLVLGTGLLAPTGPSGASHMTVTEVTGSAYGYFSNVSLFGGPSNTRGPAPTVTLPAAGSDAPITANAATGRADYGPATIFSSGPITVSTQGTTGPTGSVTSSSNIANVNASGQENFTASDLASSCTASEAGASGSTTITGGTLVTDNGDSDPTNSIPDHPEVVVTLAGSPAPNTTYEGHLHIGDTTDAFRWVFNEQVVSAEGSLTVNAAHEYLIGPAAVGELVVGRTVCGVTTPAPTTTTAPTTAPTTTPPGGGGGTEAGDQGYALVAADGGIFNFGTARFFGSTGSLRLNRPIVGMEYTPTTQGYWLVASDGGVFAFGDARFLGSTGAIRLAQPIVGLKSTSTGNGYWLVAADGGVFAFGDARFLGSTGAITLNRPIVGMERSNTDDGYWLVASDGGVFAFGDARFSGSTGAIRLNAAIVGMSRTNSGMGYHLVAADGGIFAFGDALFRGSTGAIRLNSPIVAMTPTSAGTGYWLCATDGGVFAFGNAQFRGSMGATRLNQPVVGCDVLAGTAAL